MEPKWYLVKTKPLNERRVDKRLSGAGFETLFPRMLKKNRRLRTVEVRPLFPTYLFVKFPIEKYRTIRYTHGVSKVVSFGVEPEEVRPEIIGAVREKMDGEGLVTLVKPPVHWKRGDKLRIGEGPFAGLDAIFVEELPDRDRVVLLLEAVSSFRVEMPKESLES